MKRTRLTRRTAFRLAAIFAAIISLTNVLIFSILYLFISQQLEDHLKAHIDEVRKDLVDVEESDGFDALAKMVIRRASVAQSDEDIFLLTDASSNYVAGNIRPLPVFDGWRTIDWSQLPLIGEWTATRSSTAVIGKWTKIKDGYLFVADGNGDIHDAQTMLLNGLIWGVLISSLLAIAGGLILGLNAQKRVGAIETALERVASGQLAERAPRSSSADDLDHVTAMINATLDQLQTLIGSLKQVSSDIAHDLRTPINRMRHKLEIVQREKGDLEAYETAVEDALSEIDGIAETFDALLRISEIEAGARKTRFVDVELNGLLANVTDALAAVAEEHRHHIITDFDAHGHQMAYGDRQLLSQLFINIIENSIEHCPAGAEIRVKLASDGGRAVVTISDNGPGIPAEERERVFRRLYRLEKSRSTRGSGLGLSTVAAIAALHGAKITLADNNPGLITTVSFA